MATHYLKFDDTLTAAKIRKLMSAFALLYGESDFYIQNGQAVVYDGRSLQSAERLHIERAQITRVSLRFLVVKSSFLGVRDLPFRVLLPCVSPTRYQDIVQSRPELYFITKQ